MKLTNIGVKNLPLPEKGQKVYWDKGFGVRVSQGGSKSFVIKHEGRWITLGKFPAISLKQARDAALRAKVLDTPQKRLERLSDARDAYLTECMAKNRPATVKQYRHFLSQIDCTYLTDVVRSDIDIGSPHAVMAWRVFFNWCIRNELVERNPFAHLKISWGQRNRVLTSDEIVQLWNYDYPPYSDYLKALILTGQRVGQLRSFTVTDAVVTFPAAIMKNKREHSIPATPWVCEVVGRIEPFNGWGRAKTRCDKHTGVSDWVQHDCRRFYSTTMAAIGTPLHVTEQILSHAGQVSGVAAIYNRHRFLDEAHTAQLAYEKHLKGIVDEASKEPTKQ